METSTGALTREAACFASGVGLHAVPEAVVAKARCCLLYGLGIGAACVNGEFARTALRAMLALDGASPAGGATALAGGMRLPVSAAAFANAAMLHGRCQEDTCGSAHLGVAVVPTLLALAESGRAPQENLLPALIAGYEVAGRIEKSLSRATTANGFRASPLYGTLAAAVAAGRALGLSAQAMQSAIAHAAAFTGGTLQSIAEGTHEWRYQMSAAARRGLEAALLAQAGAVGAVAPLEGELGLARAFARTALEGIVARDWVLPEVAFKHYPICNRNQAAARVASRLHRRVEPDQVRRIRVIIHPNVLAGMLERGPFHTPGQTLMSTYFGCAAALATGGITARVLEDYDDPVIAGLIARMRIETDADVPYLSARAEVETLSGERLADSEIRGPHDMSFGRQQVNGLLAGLAREMDIPGEAMQALDAYAFGERLDAVAPVLQAYGAARRPPDGGT